MMHITVGLLIWFWCIHLQKSMSLQSIPNIAMFFVFFFPRYLHQCCSLFVSLKPGFPWSCWRWTWACRPVFRAFCCPMISPWRASTWRKRWTMHGRGARPLRMTGGIWICRRPVSCRCERRWAETPLLGGFKALLLKAVWFFHWNWLIWRILYKYIYIYILFY